MLTIRKFVTFGLMVIGFSLPHLVSAASDGAAIFEESCSGCHSTSSRPLDKVHLTREQWKEVSDHMTPYGAEVPSGKKLELLLDYLVSMNETSGKATNTDKK